MQMRTDETGAEALEFALIAPILLIAVLAAIYGLLAVAAQVSLQHATGVAARYASIPTADGTFGTYPDDAAVLSKLNASTSFFKASDCTATVTGGSTQNEKIQLSTRCAFPNPLGHALGSLVGSGPSPDTLTMSAVAEARLE